MRSPIWLALGVLAACAHDQDRNRPRPPMAVPDDLRPEASRVRQAAGELLPLVLVTQLGQTMLPYRREDSDPPLLGAIALRPSWTQRASAVFVVARPAGGVQVLYEAQLSGTLDEPDFLFRTVLDRARPP